jgi:hypothetical protein
LSAIILVLGTFGDKCLDSPRRFVRLYKSILELVSPGHGRSA